MNLTSKLIKTNTWFCDFLKTNSIAYIYPATSSEMHSMKW